MNIFFVISIFCKVPMPLCGICLSVTFVYAVKVTNKCIFKNFSPSDSHSILDFLYQMLWQYSNRDTLTGASNAGGMGKNHNSLPISGYRINDCWTCKQLLWWSTVQFTEQTVTHQWILMIAACSVDDLYLYPLRWHTLPSHANTEACLTGWPNA